MFEKRDDIYYVAASVVGILIIVYPALVAYILGLVLIIYGALMVIK